MNLSLSPNPSFEQLRKQAKDILKAHKQGDPTGCSVLRHLRQFAKASDAEMLAAPIALNDVQFALALYYGYEGWGDLKRHVELHRSGMDAPRLRRRGAETVITGLEHLDWGGSFFRRQESMITCLAAAYQAAGRKTSFEEVMGISGAAFKLTMRRPWCPSAGGCGVFSDCPDRALSAFGHSMAQLPAEDGQVPQEARSAIVESIDRGVPALYMNGEFNLIVGYVDGGETWICQPYAGGAGYKRMERLEGFLGPAWWVNVLHDDKEAPPRRLALLDSIRAAVRLAKTPSFAEGSSNGFAAYEAWAEDLESPPAEPNLHANAYVYSILLSSRAAAGEYLRALAGEFDGQAAGRLTAAGAQYDRVARRMLDGRACVAQPWEESWTPENRSAEAEIMRENLADERVAIAELERFLAVTSDA